jgi:hypothetical protein
MPTARPYHEILDIDFSNGNPWQEDRRNTVIKATLGIPDGKNVSMQVDIQPDDGGRRTLLSKTEYLPDTIRNYSLAFVELFLGKNTIYIIFEDEDAPAGSDGKTEFSYDVHVENRDSFVIKRRFSFSDEYMLSGPVTMTVNDGLKLVTTAGKEEGIAVPIHPINMDGRAKINKIIVTGDADKLGDATGIRTAEYRADRGDSILQRLPLTDLRTFKAIAKIQMIDN